MHFSTLATVAFSAVASAKNIAVSVGANGGFTIEPSTIKAAVGDNVDFTFEAGIHGLSSADFEAPCKPPAKEGGFWTEFYDADSNGPVTFRVPINNTDPIWFFCAQTFFSHCQMGMVGVINAPDGKTIDDFTAAAAKAPASTHPDTVFGGFIIADSGSSGSSSKSGDSTGTSTATAHGSSASPTASAAPTGSSSSSSGSASPTASGNGTAPSPGPDNGAGSLSGMAGVAFAAVGMVVALIA